MIHPGKNGVEPPNPNTIGVKQPSDQKLGGFFPLPAIVDQITRYRNEIASLRRPPYHPSATAGLVPAELAEQVEKL
jgi:hypothetical protein